MHGYLATVQSGYHSLFLYPEAPFVEGNKKQCHACICGLRTVMQSDWSIELNPGTHVVLEVYRMYACVCRAALVLLCCWGRGGNYCAS